MCIYVAINFSPVYLELVQWVTSNLETLEKVNLLSRLREIPVFLEGLYLLLQELCSPNIVPVKC